MEEFENKILLITGGTGSFGNAVLSGFLNVGFQEIRIFSRDEKKQEEMRLKFKSDTIKFFLGDVRCIDSLNRAMRGVDFVFHAAALKQVPSCEFFPMEATKTNVLGSLNVLESARLNAVSNVVCLSTDKAAYPINAMGISKALMEKVVVAESRNYGEEGPIVCITRYGNVMASRGSVIPLFVDQLLRGEKLTITNPEMTRFMMTLNEAVDLVLYAFRNGSQGDLFVQKSPASTILDLANGLCDLFSVESNIQIIGTRHGEKLYETLLTREEYEKAVDLGEYFQVKADNRDLNYSKYTTAGVKFKNRDFEDYNSHNTVQLSKIDLLKKLKTLDVINAHLPVE
jgi:UDP-N-acetylglucosamine 4,6-dehydratase/5-epimerase